MTNDLLIICAENSQISTEKKKRGIAFITVSMSKVLLIVDYHQGQQPANKN